MSLPWQRAALTGILATLLFSLFLQLTGIFRLPNMNLALWNGTLVTLNLGAATVVGYVLEFAIGIGLTLLYVRVSPHIKGSALRKGLWYGLGLWMALMVIGLPLFGWVSPLVRDGLMMSPGFFAAHMGIAATITWLLALEIYSLSVSYLVSAKTFRLPTHS